MPDKITVKSIETRIKSRAGGFIKGDKGDKGDTGPVGPQGPIGPQGPQGIQGQKGADGVNGVDGKDGRGILSISLHKTDGKDKTYLVKYTDGTEFEFVIRDGEDGKDGADAKGMAGGAVLKGAEKTSRKSHDYTETSPEKYPSSKALSSAVTSLLEKIAEAEAKSDVVDVVGTHAELDAYDTYELADKDIVKVLADEEYDGATTYWRWTVEDDTFLLVGQTGPFASSVNNETPDENGNVTLSIPENTSDLNNDSGFITSSDLPTNFVGTDGADDGEAGLVPAPTTSDYSYVLKGTGSWGQVDYYELTNRPSIPTSSDYWTVGTNGVSDYQTTYSKKTIFYKQSNAQDNGFKMLASTDVPPLNQNGAWSGRCLIGNENRTFLLGTARNGASANASICGIGAHTWGSASAQTNAGWDNVYFQPDGATAIFLGGYGWRGNSGWMRILNNSSGSAAYRVTINTGTNTSPAWRTVLPNNSSGSNAILFTPTVGTTNSFNYSTSINGNVTATYGTCVGYGSSASTRAVGLGYNAKATGTDAIQLGQGTNSTANTLSVGLSSSLNVQLLNSSGVIPIGRIDLTQITGYDSTVAQTLKHSAGGGIEWVND